MAGQTKNRTNTQAAIENFCLPLLVGEPRRAAKIAAQLFFIYGLHSYLLAVPDRQRRFPPFLRLLTLPFLHTVMSASEDAALLGDGVIGFFAGYGEEFFPVCIDCSSEQVLQSERERLASYCVICRGEELGRVPPFCYGNAK